MAARPERVVLIGLPGSGKSTVGPLLARRLGWRFVDLDTLIERDAGLPVTEIFARHGEREFRRLEGELTARLASEPRVVLSPGGGWIVHHKLPAACIVWLQVSPAVALGRMGAGAKGRPLLQPNPLEKLKHLLAAREPYYQRADIAIDTTGKTPHAVASAIAVAIEEKHGHEEKR
ncbi:MAG: shikimate kinase [Gemmatimonadota bacterium]